MTELGNDAMLPKDYDPAPDLYKDHLRRQHEQEDVEEMEPADDEPGKDYPDPDEAPDGT